MPIKLLNVYILVTKPIGSLNSFTYRSGVSPTEINVVIASINIFISPFPFKGKGADRRIGVIYSKVVFSTGALAFFRQQRNGEIFEIRSY